MKSNPFDITPHCFIYEHSEWIRQLHLSVLHIDPSYIYLASLDWHSCALEALLVSKMAVNAGRRAEASSVSIL